MTRFKRVILVNPPGTEQAGYTPSPLGLLYLAAYLRHKNKQVNLAVIDGAIEGSGQVKKKLIDFHPDLVGILVLTPARFEALKVAHLAKRLNSGCEIVFGGVHPTFMWQQMMSHYKEIDYIVRGEGEITFYQLVSGKRLTEIDGLVWRRGEKIVKNPDRKNTKNLDKLPFPAWDLIGHLTYPARGQGIVNGINLSGVPRFTLIFSRGCMGACTFCSSWKFWKGYRSRSGRNVADEVEYLVKAYGAQHFCFQDDSFGGNRKETINFCREIIKRKLKLAFVGCTRVDLVDARLLKLLKKAGFYELAYGIESGSAEVLQKINKKTNLLAAKQAIEMTKKAGIRAIALLMYGLPGETEMDRQKTRNFLDKLKPTGIGTNGEFWIFPETPIYSAAKTAGIISDRFWLGPKPYYVYRGGMYHDPVRWDLKIYDYLKFRFSGTIFNDLRIRFLLTLQSASCILGGK